MLPKIVEDSHEWLLETLLISKPYVCRYPQEPAAILEDRYAGPGTDVTLWKKPIGVKLGPP